MTYSFLIISSLCTNITEYKKKQESVNVVVHSHSSWSNAAASSCRRTSFSRRYELFFVLKFIQSPQSTTFVGNSDA